MTSPLAVHLRAAFSHLEEATAAMEEVSRVTYFPGQEPGQIPTRGVAVHIRSATTNLKAALREGAPKELQQVVSMLEQAENALTQTAFSLHGFTPHKAPKRQPSRAVGPRRLSLRGLSGPGPIMPPQAISPFAMQMMPNMGPGPVTSMYPQGVLAPGLKPVSMATRQVGAQFQQVRVILQQARNIVQKYATDPQLAGLGETQDPGELAWAPKDGLQDWYRSGEFGALAFFGAYYASTQRHGRTKASAILMAVLFPRLACLYQVARLAVKQGP